MSTPYHSVEIVIETRSSTEALVAALLPGKIQSGSFAPNGEVLGDDSGDATITRLRYEESGRSKLVVCPAPSDAQDADARIRQLCEELNDLPEAARREWDEAELRGSLWDTMSMESKSPTRTVLVMIQSVQSLHSEQQSVS